MIRDIIKDEFLLSQKCDIASLEDISIADDLMDTVKFHQEHCVGMAANMIGELKRIIVFQDENDYTVMFNPEIIKKEGAFSSEEGCLSHEGSRITHRYKKIKVEYYDIHFKKKIKTYSGFIAQIIQHEIDHCNGILI